MATAERVLDTRIATTRSCAEQTTDTLDEIAVGDSFVLIADHDPIGLQYMLAAERPGVANWELLDDGPPYWRVRIRKGEPTSAR
jgi:uncharacterized protein (DUF2249 family)